MIRAFGEQTSRDGFSRNGFPDLNSGISLLGFCLRDPRLIPDSTWILDFEILKFAF